MLNRLFAISIALLTACATSSCNRYQKQQMERADEQRRFLQTLAPQIDPQTGSGRRAHAQFMVAGLQKLEVRDCPDAYKQAIARKIEVWTKVAQLEDGDQSGHALRVQQEQVETYLRDGP